MIGVMGDGKRHRFYASRCRVLVVVGMEQVAESGVEGAMGSEAGVRGPQVSEHLRDVKDFVVNMCMAEGEATT